MSDDDLGPLPQLKAFTLTGPAHFSVQAFVLVRIQDTKDTLGTDWQGLGARFSKWSFEQKLYATKILTSGGGYFEAMCPPEDAEKIRAWLTEQGGQDQTVV